MTLGDVEMQWMRVPRAVVMPLEIGLEDGPLVSGPAVLTSYVEDTWPHRLVLHSKGRALDWEQAP